MLSETPWHFELCPLWPYPFFYSISQSLPSPLMGSDKSSFQSFSSQRKEMTLLTLFNQFKYSVSEAGPECGFSDSWSKTSFTNHAASHGAESNKQE